LHPPERSIWVLSGDDQVSHHHEELVSVLLGFLVAHEVLSDFLVNQYAIVLGGDGKQQ
jgi:hypothetical protein